LAGPVRKSDISPKNDHATNASLIERSDALIPLH